MNTRKTGQYYEDRAADFLKERGYMFVEQNYRCKYGEIDIIARHNGYLVFVEVKYRHDEGSGEAVAAVDFRKQRKICNVARWYLMDKKLGENTKCRFDVVGVMPTKMEIYENAFDYMV